MLKKLFGMILALAIFAACSNQGEKKEVKSNTKIAKVTVGQVMDDVQNYVDKDVIIEGTVNHVCEHGGKRMFIMGTDPDVAIKITPNKEIGAFNKELEGSHVMITGTVKELRIDEAYVANLEKELAENTDNEAVHDHSGGKHEEEANAETKTEKNPQIEAMKAKIAESENGYYSQYWIEASKFEVVEPANEEMQAEKAEHEHAEGEEHSH